MPKRNWTVKWSYGYAGTDNEEQVDAMEHLGLEEEEFDAKTDEEVRRELADDFYDVAIQRVECWAEPTDED